MFVAVNLNSANPNKVIDAEVYSPAEDDCLCCPDPECQAELIYIRESEEEASFKRATHYRTKRGFIHRDNCREYAKAQDYRKKIECIKTAVKAGKTIILSLNDVNGKFGLPPALKRDFVREASQDNTPLGTFKCDHTGLYKMHSAKSIAQIIDALSIIEKFGSKDALNQTQFTFEREIQSFTESQCKTKKEAKALFKKLYARAKNQEHALAKEYQGSLFAYDMPHDLLFAPSENTRNQGLNQKLFHSVPVVIPTGNSGTVILQHVLAVKMLPEGDKQTILNAASVRIFATPQVNYSRSAEEFKKSTKENSSFIRIKWRVLGGHQIHTNHHSNLPTQPNRETRSLLTPRP